MLQVVVVIVLLVVVSVVIREAFVVWLIFYHNRVHGRDNGLYRRDGDNGRYRRASHNAMVKVSQSQSKPWD